MMRLGMMVAIAGLASPVYAQNNALTRSEMQALRTQIQACWLVTGDVPSVTLGFSLDGKGRPVAASMKARGHAPAAKTAVEKAYALAKRAV